MQGAYSIIKAAIEVLYFFEVRNAYTVSEGGDYNRFTAA